MQHLCLCFKEESQSWDRQVGVPSAPGPNREFQRALFLKVCSPACLPPTSLKTRPPPHFPFSGS